MCEWKWTNMLGVGFGFEHPLRFKSSWYIYIPKKDIFSSLKMTVLGKGSVSPRISLSCHERFIIIFLLLC